MMTRPQLLTFQHGKRSTYGKRAIRYVPLFLCPLLLRPSSFLPTPFLLPPWSPPAPLVLSSAFFAGMVPPAEVDAPRLRLYVSRNSYFFAEFLATIFKRFGLRVTGLCANASLTRSFCSCS